MSDMTNETAAEMTDTNTFTCTAIAKYARTPRYVVHVKGENVNAYGDDEKKYRPVVVVGAYRDLLLVELPAPVSFGRWVDVRFYGIRVDQTREGHRLVRTVIRAIKTIAALGREGARTRKTAEKLAAIAAGRVGRDGECQICEGRQIVNAKGKLVLHGYTRPGDGYAHGSCYGVSELPYEKSCDALRRWVGQLGAMREDRIAGLAKLATATELTVRRYTGKSRDGYEFVTSRQGEPRFANDLDLARANLQSDIRHIGFDIERGNARIAAWNPAK